MTGSLCEKAGKRVRNLFRLMDIKRTIQAEKEREVANKTVIA